MALAIEPEPELASEATLESAARANDFPTFDALYRANPDPAYRTLHEVWTYAMTDRVGAFYGAEMHDKLAREYPRYAEFIARHEIVDANGAVFYPSSETRAFLLGAVEPQIAERPLPSTRSAGILPAVPAKHEQPAASRSNARREAGAPQPAPRVAARPVQVPVVIPPSTHESDLALLETPVSTPAPAPAAEPAHAVAETTTMMPRPPKGTNRGILLVIIGLIGVGLLALIVRAPREVIP